MVKNIIYNCQNGCPVESTLQFISGKWKSVILYHLLTNDELRFRDLHLKLANCSKRMLALQLKELENDNLIIKITYSINPLKTKYLISPFGQTLETVIMAMNSWGDLYNNNQLPN